MQEEKNGYYTVLVEAGNGGAQKIPYIVFAASDYHAARIVRQETGYLASQHDVEGPRMLF